MIEPPVRTIRITSPLHCQCISFLKQPSLNTDEPNGLRGAHEFPVDALVQAREAIKETDRLRRPVALCLYCAGCSGSKDRWQAFLPTTDSECNHDFLGVLTES